MTFDPDASPPTGTAAILRALGSLVAAIGSEEARREAQESLSGARGLRSAPPRPGTAVGASPARRTVSDPQEPMVTDQFNSDDYEAPEPEAYPRQQIRRAPATRRTAPLPSEARRNIPQGSIADAQLILSDARERAERLLQNSLDRASELLNRERVPATISEPLDLEPLRLDVDELLRGMRDVQQRLDRIEGTLADLHSAIAPRVPAAEPPVFPPAPAERPPFAPPPEAEHRPGVLSVVSPPAPPPVPPMRPTVSASRAAVRPPALSARPAPAVPASAVPPMRSSSSPPAAESPAYQAPPPVDEPDPESWQSEYDQSAMNTLATNTLATNTLATFTPADGAVSLRAAPVSGFQGLMRLQDALQNIPAVRQATVEAYSQGEARLRIELDTNIDSDEIAEGVTIGLGQTAVVREASEVDRNMVIAFG